MKIPMFHFFFLILDYEASISEKSETPESISEPPETESESPEPKSVSSENLTNISPSLSSEEQIIEPTKTSTILISEPISEPIMEDTLSKEEEREVSTHNSEKLVEEDPVAEPDVESVVESGKIKLLQGFYRSCFDETSKKSCFFKLFDRTKVKIGVKIKRGR